MKSFENVSILSRVTQNSRSNISKVNVMIITKVLISYCQTLEIILDALLDRSGQNCWKFCEKMLRPRFWWQIGQTKRSQLESVGQRLMKSWPEFRVPALKMKRASPDFGQFRRGTLTSTLTFDLSKILSLTSGIMSVNPERIPWKMAA